MFPLEHFLVAAIPVFGYYLVRYRQLPSKAMLFVVFFGSQFPDLIDKPLAHSIFVLPAGRVFMHSLPFAIPICILVMAYGTATDRPELSTGFVWAYLIHIPADLDLRQLVLTGDVPQNLLWPLVEASPGEPIPNWAGPGGINVSLWTMFSIIVLSGTFILLAMDISFQMSDHH